MKTLRLAWTPALLPCLRLGARRVSRHVMICSEPLTALFWGISLAIGLVGCGGGTTSAPPPPPPPPVVHVTISPNYLTVIDQGQSFNFTAITDDVSGKGVSWSLTGPGKLTNATTTSVTYNATSFDGASVGDPVTLAASSIANPQDNASIAFRVMPSPIITTTSLPDGNVGSQYGTRIEATGGLGQGAMTLNITNGSLPPGLMFNGSGYIAGTPLFPVQTYTFTVTAVDNNSAGMATSAPVTLSINIKAPLPPTIVTPMPVPASIALPDAYVNIDYNATITAKDGIPPYTLSLAPGSNPLPAGLALNTPAGLVGEAFISGKPTTAGTTNNLILQVADSLSPPGVSAPVTYSLTVRPSTNFVGTQAPGDIWQLVIGHSSPTDGAFEATDQGSRGLPGATTWKILRPFSTVNAGFRKYFSHFGVCTPDGCDEFFGYAVEMRDEMELLQPDDVPALGYLSLTASRVVASVANSCPNLSAPFPATAAYQFVTLPPHTFSTTDTAYCNVTLTQTAASSYDLTVTTFPLSGPSNGWTTFSNISCDATLQTITAPGTSPVTAAFSSHGALVMDNGTGIPIVGVQQPPGMLLTSTILAGQYLGVLYQSNSQASIITQMVGFGGPNPGTTLTGGPYTNIDSDAFSAHATNLAIALGTQASPGLFPGGTLTIGTTTVTSFDVVAGQVNGKLVLYGVGLDSSNSSSPQPAAVLLVQQ